MKLLLVTEKFSPNITHRDGGARLVDTLIKGFKPCIRIMQFGGASHSKANWYFDYPIYCNDRFEQRIRNATFIAKKVKSVENQFTHIAFIHISMQFGCVDTLLSENIQIWTFPMLLTPSYQLSGEVVPTKYTEMERLALYNAKNILTPSYLEKKQLIDFYEVRAEKIHVVPRGVDNKLLLTKIRFCNNVPTFCSLASIKPQKNTLGLIDLFSKIRNKFPGAKLNIIGPVQNQLYYDSVKKNIARLGLSDAIELRGYVSPDKLSLAIQDAHIHIFTSYCETFGRSIFETLASGIPNIGITKNNAAADFLSNLPYARFLNNHEEVLDIIPQIIDNLAKLSEMSLEIGNLYGVKMVDKLIVANIRGEEPVAISDFDGSLFHKNDSDMTKKYMSEYNAYTTKIICSARGLRDLMEEIQAYSLKVNWIIAYSGAVIADHKGNILFTTPIDVRDIKKIESIVPQANQLIIDGQVIQLSMPENLLPNIFDLHVETYQGTAFISSWQSSKLRAIHKLLSHINWSGTVVAFGDSKYDKEFLNFFDGKLIQGNH